MTLVNRLTDRALEKSSTALLMDLEFMSRIEVTAFNVLVVLQHLADRLRKNNKANAMKV